MKPPVLTFLGSGDAFSSGGRLQSGILISDLRGGLLLDCGTTLLAALENCNLTTDDIDVVAVSHLHGDHFGGLVFLLLDALFVRKRTKPLLLIGPEDLESRCRKVCQNFYPGVLDRALPFALHFRTVGSSEILEESFFSLTTYPARHGQQQALSLRVDIGGRTIAYSGDTEWTDTLALVARHSDLLICECCTYEEKLPGHIDFLTLQQHAAELETKQMILTHTGAAIDQNRERITFDIAYDGLRLQL